MKVFTNMNYFCLGPLQEDSQHKFTDYEGPLASNRFVDLAQMSHLELSHSSPQEVPKSPGTLLPRQ